MPTLQGLCRNLRKSPELRAAMHSCIRYHGNRVLSHAQPWAVRKGGRHLHHHWSLEWDYIPLNCHPAPCGPLIPTGPDGASAPVSEQDFLNAKQCLTDLFPILSKTRKSGESPGLSTGETCRFIPERLLFQTMFQKLITGRSYNKPLFQPS